MPPRITVHELHRLDIVRKHHYVCNLTIWNFNLGQTASRIMSSVFVLSKYWCDGKSKVVLFGYITLFGCFVWTGYRWKQKRDRTYYSIGDLRDSLHLRQQTIDLLHSEWKDQDGRHPLLGRKSTPLPCHRIVFKTEPESIFNLDVMTETVVAHVCLSPAARAMSLAKWKMLLKIKMDPSSIRQRAKAAGIDLNEERFHDEDGNLTLDALTDSDFVKEVNVGSLVVDAHHRRKGLARMLLCESMLFLHGIGYTKCVGMANRKLVPFYEHLGAMKEGKETYTTNTIVTEIGGDLLSKCRDTLQQERHRLHVAI